MTNDELNALSKTKLVALAESYTEQIATLSQHAAIWADLATRSFDWADETKVIGETPVTALHYLIAYGAKQSSSDTEAGFAAFIGLKDDGSIPTNAKTAKQRDAIAKDLNMDHGYNDNNIEHRKSLAESYFAKANADKWTRIVDGSLAVGSRSRLTSDESRLMDMAEIGLVAHLTGLGRAKADTIKKRQAARAELVDANAATVWRTIVADWLESNRDDYTAQLAAAKVADAALVAKAKAAGFTLD